MNCPEILESPWILNKNLSPWKSLKSSTIAVGAGKSLNFNGKGKERKKEKGKEQTQKVFQDEITNVVEEVKKTI